MENNFTYHNVENAVYTNQSSKYCSHLLASNGVDIN